MLDDMINENFRIIAESIKLIEDRFERITLSDDFVSNADGIFVLDAISLAKNHCSKNHKYRMIL
jgi:hypothetical protein